MFFSDKYCQSYPSQDIVKNPVYTMEKVEKRTLELRERANIIRRAQAKIDKENGEKRYKCNECPSKYANSGTLYRHKQTHATNCNFRCGICEKVFKTELTLYSHRISHLERTIKCNLCDLSFKSSSRMIAHKKVHTGEKHCQRHNGPRVLTL